MIVLVLGILAQQAAAASGVSDTIQIWLGILTIVLVLVVFAYEQWAKWFPFRLLGTRVGSDWIAEDPRRVDALTLVGDTCQFVLKIEPRVGGPCTDVSAMFQRPATLFERRKSRNRFLPTAHYVSPDIVDITELRIIAPTQEVIGIPDKTTGKKDIFRLIPSVSLTPYEIVTCLVTAQMRRAWSGEFSLRLTVSGVTRHTIRVKVNARP